MKVALLTNIVSPHQLPLAEGIVKLVGVDNYCYAYTESFHEERAIMGWGDGHAPKWCKKADACRDFLNRADILYSGVRDIPLFERRANEGRKTFYISERWFKPFCIARRINLPGIFKLLSLRYLKMARKIVSLLELRGLVYLPQGIWAARDMTRICGLMHGDVRCLFRAPELSFENKPGGKIWLKNGGDGRKYCCDKMRMWGYFVKSSEFRGKSLASKDESAAPVSHSKHSHSPIRSLSKSSTLRVLWVGRLLKLKRVDTIIRAVGELSIHNSHTHPLSNFQLSLDIYGTGPEEARLKKIASKYGDVIKFYPPVPIEDVRKLMREHDVYVLASNGYEGWGAVVSEALEEGMTVLGTYEAGSSMTMLPKTHVFHAGDWKSLAKSLLSVAKGELGSTGIGEWTAEYAAERLMTIV